MNLLCLYKQRKTVFSFALSFACIIFAQYSQHIAYRILVIKDNNNEAGGVF